MEGIALVENSLVEMLEQAQARINAELPSGWSCITSCGAYGDAGGSLQRHFTYAAFFYFNDEMQSDRTLTSCSLAALVEMATKSAGGVREMTPFSDTNVEFAGGCSADTCAASGA